tara:strand:- start:23 stop:415 length:393 start_codon:yes stop_codon:yes gene_type:complete
MSKKPIIDLVYDGYCPLCSCAAEYYRIQRQVGVLNLIDARTSNDPILKEITKRKIDLDEGMVVRKDGVFYHGKDALSLMAQIGSNENWYNKLNKHLFASTTSASFSYPYLRALRNLLLKIRGAGKINNLG